MVSGDSHLYNPVEWGLRLIFNDVSGNALFFNALSYYFTAFYGH
jgi:hypothetical protein